VFDQSGYGSRPGGSARKHGGPAAQPPRVSSGAGDDRVLSLDGEPRAFVIGGNSNTLAFVNSFKPEGTTVSARLVPIAWTPLGVAIGDSWQNVGIALSGLIDWIDRTFPPEDERAFIAPMRDLELLARIEWNAPIPERLDDSVVLNIEDVPDDVADALARPAAAIVQCAICRRLCVAGDFTWKERELCAWDYHAQVFGKRGPWRNGAYEHRHFETLPACAYVAPPLLDEVSVQVVLATNALDDAVARSIVNVLLDADPQRAYLAVRTEGGYTVLREHAPAGSQTGT
jgi:hypothetical protein